MIFAMTGTESFPFNRLIKEIDSLKKNNIIKDDIFIQLGSSTYEPVHCSWERWLPFGEISEKIKKSEIVVAHAGAGTTLLCLELGKMPIIVPRYKKFSEHIDDHQIPFCKMMEKLEYAIPVYEISEMKNVIKNVMDNNLSHYIQNKDNSRLIKYLNNWFLN